MRDLSVNCSNTIYDHKKVCDIKILCLSVDQRFGGSFYPGNTIQMPRPPFPKYVSNSPFLFVAERDPAVGAALPLLTLPPGEQLHLLLQLVHPLGQHGILVQHSPDGRLLAQGPESAVLYVKVLAPSHQFHHLLKDILLHLSSVPLPLGSLGVNLSRCRCRCRCRCRFRCRAML